MPGAVLQLIRHRNHDSIRPRPWRPSSHLQKYSVNPNGWLRWPTRRRGSAVKGTPAMPIEFTAKPSRRSLPVHARRARTGSPTPGSMPRRPPGRRPTASPAKPAALLTLPGASGSAGAARCSASASGDDAFGALGVRRAGAAAARGRLAFRVDARRSDARGDRPEARQLSSSRATARSPAGRSRFALPAGADAAHVERVADAVFLTRDLVNTPTNDMGPDALEQAARIARRQAQGEGLGDHGRRAARARISR